jgi:hypothetical protein
MTTKKYGVKSNKYANKTKVKKLNWF